MRLANIYTFCRQISSITIPFCWVIYVRPSPLHMCAHSTEAINTIFTHFTEVRKEKIEKILSGIFHFHVSQFETIWRTMWKCSTRGHHHPDCFWRMPHGQTYFSKWQGKYPDRSFSEWIWTIHWKTCTTCTHVLHSHQSLVVSVDCRYEPISVCSIVTQMRPRLECPPETMEYNKACQLS